MKRKKRKEKKKKKRREGEFSAKKRDFHSLERFGRPHLQWEKKEDLEEWLGD